MNWNKLNISPIMGEKLSSENTLQLDFSSSNPELEKVDLGNTPAFNSYVFEQLEQAGKKYGIGGYLEKRAIYRRSDNFLTEAEDYRNIHLGVDIWTNALAPIFAPLDGRIHSFQDNTGFGDYGPTIILEHWLEDRSLYALYGHLKRSDLENLRVGQEFQAGDCICQVGPYPENGDWPPHLHFQLMWDMGENWGDYPGVAAERNLDFYRENCPDPKWVLGYP
jgi:peptidoglycan LD-endopeptidase LytH